MSLPAYVRDCGVCNGAGSYVQSYNAGCGMGSFRMMGECDWCKGTGYVYRGTGAAVPASVLNQIRVSMEASE